MKKFWLAMICLVPAAMSAAEYKIDASHSSAQFSVRHLMVSNVKGEFAKVTGSANWDPNNLAASSVTAVIDASSVNTREPKRDEHLKSPDFFDVAKFPSLQFTSKKFYREGGAVKIAGDLTIHGVKRPVVLNLDGPTAEVKDPWGMQRMGASATTKINRTDFGLVWNKALEAGGVMVGDEVAITLDIELVRQK
jgi:polyisoprenoid-binding protein YceI